MTDLDIANAHTMQPISSIGEKLGLTKEELVCYGKYKAKLQLQRPLPADGNLILVTAMTPTSVGEGKTTLSIGLADALQSLGKETCLALREPSLGPVFGMKGGATGGGKSQVVPMEDINLHFTGDFHAITAANNLLCAMIDNHLFQGNLLHLKPESICFHRCVDINDRALRQISIAQDDLPSSVPRTERFHITSASEIMSIVCLSEDLASLKTNLGNILIGWNTENNPVFAKDLHAQDAMTILLKDALQPNLVQTLEGTPALIHGGPFANIALGCNSIIATKTALTLADYCITEAGFGADLGGEKFFDIKCRRFSLQPKVIVLVVTVRALKLHGGADKSSLQNPDHSALKKGLDNLGKHLDNLQNVFNRKVICAINHFLQDTDAELKMILDYCQKQNLQAHVCDVYHKGGAGATSLAQTIFECCQEETKPLTYAYQLSDDLVSKTKQICQKIYGATDVILTDDAKATLERIAPLANGLPVCIAKTQYSLSDDAQKYGLPQNFAITIRDFELRNGAGFVVAIAGNILLMPGLSPYPAACQMTIEADGRIHGLF